jgi:cytoskeleton protein RodZ
MAEQQLLIPMACGERLGEARREQRQSLEVCAAALRIPVETLMAIEADQFERFAPIYRKGYIKAYARHLGFDQETIDVMVASVEDDAPVLKPVFDTPPPIRSGDRWFRAASYVLASLLIGTLAWQLTHEAVRLYRAAESAPLAENGEPSRETRVLPAPARPDHVNASIASLEELGRKRAATAEDPAKAAWSALKQPAEAEIIRELPPGYHRLQLETSGDSWVEIIDAAGDQLEMDLIRGGATRQYEGLAPFRVLFGRASAVSLAMDGRAVDLTGFTTGDVMQMSLDEGFVEAMPTDATGNDPLLQ